MKSRKLKRDFFVSHFFVRVDTTIIFSRSVSQLCSPLATSE